MRPYEARGWSAPGGQMARASLAIDELPFQQTISRLPGMSWYRVNPIAVSEPPPSPLTVG